MGWIGSDMGEGSGRGSSKERMWGPQRGLRILITYSGLWDEQSNTTEDEVRDLETILRLGDSTGL